MATQDKDTTKYLYHSLKGRGYNVGKDTAEFENLLLKNPDSRKWAYEKGRLNGLNVGKSYEEFSEKVAPKAQRPKAQRPTTEQGWAHGVRPNVAGQKTTSTEDERPTSTKPEAKRNATKQSASRPSQNTGEKKVAPVPLTADDNSKYGYSQAQYESATPMVDDIAEQLSTEKQPLAPMDTQRVIGKKVEDMKRDLNYDSRYNEAVVEVTKENMRNITERPLKRDLSVSGVDSGLQNARKEVGDDLGVYLLDKAVANAIADEDKRKQDDISTRFKTRFNGGMSPLFSGDIIDRQTYFDADKMAEKAVSNMSAEDKAEIISSLALSAELDDLRKAGVPDYRLPNKPSQKYIDQATKNLNSTIRSELVMRIADRWKPKNGFEQFMSKFIGGNTATMMATYGLMPKSQIESSLLGQQMYDQENGVGVAGYLGMAAGMTSDPLLYLTGGTSTAATQLGTNLATRMVLKKTATKAAQKAFANKFVTKVGQRAVGGAVNLGLYEGGLEAIRQGAYGGYYNPETGQIEGFNPGAILSQTIHGSAMGAAVGATGLLFGNASQKAVDAIGTGTVGQTVARAGVLTASKVVAPALEATVFSIPEFISSDDNKFDIWAGNMAFIAANKAVGGLTKMATQPKKSAVQTIKDLSSMTKNDGYLSVRERVDDYITRHNGEPNYFLSKDELQELQTKGYGDLGLLFSGEDKYFARYENATSMDDAARQLKEKGEYSLLAKAVGDERLSQAVRARLYFIATDRCLPVHTAVKTNIEDTGRGYAVQTYDKDGAVITCKYFKDRAKAEQYKATNADRQIELNAMYMADYNMTQKALLDANEEVINELAQKYDQTTYAIRRILKDYAADPEAADDIVKKIHKEFVDTLPGSEEVFKNANANMQAVKDRIKEGFGVGVDEAMRKKASERNVAEQNAIDAYLDACEQANKSSDVYEKIKLNGSDNVLFAVLDDDKTVAIQRGEITVDKDGQVVAKPGKYRCYDFELDDYFDVDMERIVDAQMMPIESYKQRSEQVQREAKQGETKEESVEPTTAETAERAEEGIESDDVQANEIWTLPVNGRKAEAVVVDREGDKITVWTSEAITEGSEKPRTFGRGYVTELTADEFLKLGARPKEEFAEERGTSEEGRENPAEEPMQAQSAPTEPRDVEQPTAEQPKEVEQPTAEQVTPTEEVDPNAMPMREVKYSDGEVGKEPDFSQATPERTARYLDGESGMESTDVDKFVANMIAKSAKAVEEHSQKRPEMGEDEMPGRFSQRLNEWKRQGEELQTQKAYWDAVNAERERVKSEEVVEAESPTMEAETAEPTVTALKVDESPVPEASEPTENASLGEGAERVKAVEERTQSLSNDFGVKVKVAKSIEDVANADAREAIRQGVKVTGYYDEGTGEVVIYAPNVDDASKIDKTYAHEVVGHIGMRGLLGEEKYNDFCNQVWNYMSEDAQRRYAEYPGVEGDTALAADEYLAHVAENIDVYKGTTMWERIKQAVRSALQDLGITNVTDKDIEYMLRRSAERLRKQQSRNKIVSDVNSLFSVVGGSGTHYSISSGFEGAGFVAGNKVGNDLEPLADAEGNAMVKLGDKEFSAKNPITEKDVLSRKSILKMMLDDARKLGAIDDNQYNKIVRKYTQQLNYYLQIGAKENGGVENLTERWQWLGDTVFKTIASNSDKQYNTSMDITRVCKKNEAVIRAISELQKRQGYGVTPAQILDIYESTVVEGYQAPCPVCYVFSRYIRNGKQASSIIYGMRKYGKYLKGGEGPTWTVDDWVAELDRMGEEKETFKKAIADANEDVLMIPETIDNLIKEIRSAKGDKELIAKNKAKIKELDVKYRQALDIISRQSMTNWIKSFAIQKVDSKWLMREDAELPKDMKRFEELALDVRRTSEAMVEFPGIQRHRKSYGAAAGKEITFASNNELGDVALGIGINPAKFSNKYKECSEATDSKRRSSLRKSAREALMKSLIKAKQQSLRGGQRMWSWSDNIERLSNDVAVNLMQLEIIGCALQSYSKQLEGIRLVASMGGYVNGSLMGDGNGYKEVKESDTEVINGVRVLKGGDYKYTIENEDGTKEERVLHSPVYQDEDGKMYTLAFDDVVGIDPFGKDDGNGNHLKGLFELNATMDKAGNILVGMNDTHIKTALADDRIFFVIPWHASGGNTHILAQMLGYLGVDVRNLNPEDYTNMQEEKRIKLESECKEDEKNAWKVSNALVDFWEAHNYEKKYRCGIGYIESGKDGRLSEGQAEYRKLRECILKGVAEEVWDAKGKKYKTKYFNVSGYPELMKKILADEFLSQAYYKINEDPVTKVPGGLMTSEDCKYIYPYEYWDEKSTYETADVNGERYLEYCRRLGHRPKFSGSWDAEKGTRTTKVGNFVDSKGYWKLLIDRRMYGVDGKFQDLTPVDSEGFKPEYTDSELTKKEFVVTKVADEGGVQRIVDRSIAKMISRTGEMPNVDYNLSMEEAVKRYNSNSTTVTPALWKADDVFGPAHIGLSRKVEPTDLVGLTDNKGRVFFRVEDDGETIGEATSEGALYREGEPEFRFIGEKGAAAIDRAEEATTRLDNLDVARKMESARKGAKAIKLATGWERGADGKWRYEVVDSDIRPAEEWLYSKKPLKLKDILTEDDEVFKMYPEMRDVKIVKGRALDWRGEYVHGKEMTLPFAALRFFREKIGPKEDKYFKETLYHEIQHYIQHVEGFALGGNENMILSPEIKKEAQKLLGEAQTLANRYNNRHDVGDIDIYKVEKWRREAIEARDRFYAFMREHKLGYKDYIRLAGEVESRNTEARMKMTAEERRNSLASATEDVAREDQIFLFDSLNNESTGRMDERAEGLDNREFGDGEVATPARKTATELAAERMQLYRDTAENVAKSVGEEVTVVEDIEDITDDNPTLQLKKRGAKGWFDPETGKVVVNLSAHRDAADVVETVLHETIGHKGIEEMMGRERFERMIDEVWSHAADDVRRAVSGLMQSNRNWDYRKATREYLAGLAEKVDQQGYDNLSRSEQSIWQKVKSKIEDFLNRILSEMNIPAHVRLGEKDLSYMMWKVYDTKRREAQGETVIDKAQGEMRDRDWSKNGRVKVVSDEQVTDVSADMSLTESLREAAKQDYGSAGTSINANKLPTGFGLISKRGGWQPGTTNLDMGGGRFDNATEMLAEQGVTNLIFDPYNRSEEHNRKVAQEVYSNKVDTTTCNNVLNVINTKGARSNVILQCAKALKPGGVSYFTVYEGNGTGRGAVSKNDCWQENRKTEDYVSEIEQHYRDVKRVGKLIIASDPIVDGKVSVWMYNATGESSLEFRDADEQAQNVQTADDIFDGEIIGMLKKQGEDVRTLNTAIEAMADSTAKISKILGKQKTYDKETVKNVSMAIRRMLAADVFSTPSKSDINSMLGAVQHSIDKDNITESVDRLTDMFIDNQQRLADRTFDKLCSTKGSKINKNGVESIARLDPRGQMILNELNTAKELSPSDIMSRRDELQDKIDFGTEAQRAEAEIKLLGLDIADKYKNDMTDLNSSIALITNDLDELKKSYSRSFTKEQKNEYREQKKCLYELLREAKLGRLEATRRVSEDLYATLNGSFSEAKEFRERQANRKNEVQHDANSDLIGVSTSEVGKGRTVGKFLTNNSLARVFLAPLGTFEQMCRMFGSRYIDGEGKLFNRFVKGWQKCSDVEQIENEQAEDELNETAALLLDKDKARFSDLYDISKKVACKLSWMDGKEEKVFTITQGNLMYIYAVNKMPDGKVKLKKMGLPSAKIDEVVEKSLDPRLRKLADWAQSEFLPKLRDKYSAVNERMFGSPMEDIENYYPIRILENSLVKEDELKDTGSNALPKTITGSVIKRTYNTKPIDILNSDGVSVLLSHVREMNNWASFAEYRQDLSTLLSYKTFSNKLKNMSTIYGAGNAMWKNFHDLAMVVAGAYEPKVGTADKNVVNLSKIAVGSCIAIRLNTALKQTLSYPAFAQDADLARMVYNVTPWRAAQSFKWAKENMPAFRKRWSSKQAGNEILKEWKQDWNWTQTEFMKAAQRIGMSPNAFIDALTVATGSEAVYQAKKKQYVKQGLSEQEAHDKAILDAEVTFNLSQQSSEAPYISMMQAERTYLTTMITMFRNSSMSYARQMVQSGREIANMIKYKESQLYNETQKLVEQGMDEESAKKEAERRYYKNYARNVVKAVNFAYVLPTLWSLGCSGVYYLIFGDDKDKKKDLLEDSAKRGALGCMEGFTFGGTLPQVIYDLAQGNDVNFETNPNIALAMLSQTIDSMQSKSKEKAIVNFMNAIVSSTIGLNPMTVEDLAISAIDYFGVDEASGRDVALLAMRIANCPQSQMDMVYFDELGMTAREASKRTPRELCERYAQYKAMRAYFPIMRAIDEQRWGELKDPYRKQFNDEAKKLLETKSGKAVNEAYDKYESYYKEANKRITDIRNSDMAPDEKRRELKNVYTSGDLGVAHKFMSKLNSYLERMAKSWLNAETAEEAAKNLNSYINYKAELVDLMNKASDNGLQNEPSKELREAAGKLEGTLQEWAKRNPKYVRG